MFVYAIPTDTVETIMKRLIEMTQSSVAPENMRLAYNGTFMSPSDTLAQYTTQDGDILHEIRCIGTNYFFFSPTNLPFPL